MLRVVDERAPGWSPRFVDDIIADQVYLEVQNFAWAVKTDPEHPLRKADRHVPRRVRRRPAERRGDDRARASGIKDQVVEHPDVQRFIGQAWDDGARSSMLDAAADPSSALRLRVRDGLLALRRAPVRGRRAARARSTAGWRTPRATSCGTTAREITTLITDTVDAVGRGGDLAQGRAAGGPRPAVHPDQRHRRGRAGRAGHLHGDRSCSSSPGGWPRRAAGTAGR